MQKIKNYHRKKSDTTSRYQNPGNLQPKDMQQPICSPLREGLGEAIQNAPNAPDPTGLAAALGLLGTQGLFKDMTGLEGTQNIALQGMLGNQQAAFGYASMASKLAALGNTERLMKAIQKSGLLPDKQAELMQTLLGKAANFNGLGGDGSKPNPKGQQQAADYTAQMEAIKNNPLLTDEQKQYYAGQLTGKGINDWTGTNAVAENIGRNNPNALPSDYNEEVSTDVPQAGEGSDIFQDSQNIVINPYTGVLSNRKTLGVLALSATLNCYMEGFQTGGYYDRLGFDINFQPMNLTTINLPNGRTIRTMGATGVRYILESDTTQNNWQNIQNYAAAQGKISRIGFVINLATAVNVHDSVYALIHEVGVHVMPYIDTLISIKQQQSTNLAAGTAAFAAFAAQYSADALIESNTNFSPTTQHLAFQQGSATHYERMLHEILSSLKPLYKGLNKHFFIDRTQSTTSSFWKSIPGNDPSSDGRDKIYGYPSTNVDKSIFGQNGEFGFLDTTNYFVRHKFLHEQIEEADLTSKSQYL